MNLTDFIAQHRSTAKNPTADIRFRWAKPIVARGLHQQGRAGARSTSAAVRQSQDPGADEPMGTVGWTGSVHGGDQGVSSQRRSRSKNSWCQCLPVSTFTPR